MITRTRDEVYQLWIDALRSGEYKQGYGCLRRKEGGEFLFCCLGVLQDLAVKDGGRPWGTPGGWVDPYSAHPTQEIIDFMGLTGDDIDDLVNYNDGRRYTFKVIAKRIELIRKSLKGL